MKIDCGIIGLPNVGKSTLFSVLTDISVRIANFPFCTIQPNVAVVHVFDPRIYALRNIVKSRKLVPSVIEFVDIAGVIKGAAHGEGLGDKTLQYIREVKVLCHVVRCFDDDHVAHITGSVDPNRDINVINNELILFDILQCEQIILALKKKHKIYDDNIQKKLFVLNKCLINLYNGIVLRKVQFSYVEKINILKFNFLTLKPVIYVANIDMTYKNNIYLNKLNNIISSDEKQLIVSCCASSLLLNNTDMNYDCDHYVSDIINQRKYILKNIINNIFFVLNLHTFFTINASMIRAWINITGITALEAANRVHSDFKKGFIRVQVIKFNDFIDHKGMLETIKKAGKIYFEGKNYCVQDGDILKFLFSKIR